MICAAGYDVWAVVWLAFPTHLPALKRLRIMAAIQVRSSSSSRQVGRAELLCDSRHPPGPTPEPQQQPCRVTLVPTGRLPFCLQDLSPLARFPTLQQLDIAAVEVCDLSPISMLTGLQDLNLFTLQASQAILLLTAGHSWLLHWMALLSTHCTASSALHSALHSAWHRCPRGAHSASWQVQLQ
jgi:hypothetical protein